jgi:hypothetical protein
MKVGGGRAWAKGGFRNALRSSGQAGATAEKATATAGTKNDVATIAKYWGAWRVELGQRQRRMRLVAKSGAVV